MLDRAGGLDRRLQGLHRTCRLLRRLQILELCEWVDERKRMDSANVCAPVLNMVVASTN